MKCKDCYFMRYFGDYSLDYCYITSKQVEDEFECHCPKRRKEEWVRVLKEREKRKAGVSGYLPIK